MTVSLTVDYIHNVYGRGAQDSGSGFKTVKWICCFCWEKGQTNKQTNKKLHLFLLKKTLRRNTTAKETGSK